MALHDEEQRRLLEIERQLAAENPRLAQRLAELRPMRLSGVLLSVLGILCSPVAGLFLLVAAAQSHAPVLYVIGTVFTSVLPTALIWRAWLHRLP
ncbi:DUF3040 domain-containing protein [Amycolatopsis viridis]|uniref:DUF3040 domain-containing protein n=1 Tax=Amycolatopsis viridis TaxID=185678 RepID=A0ABX0SRH9_9PSEU|nr:DUF3040 domain-containing protein [Amycolatopsis viridis]NIH77961.1 hypothetical protein [Amycolatopsis viridis]